MTLSIIIPTVGRRHEVDKLLSTIILPPLEYEIILIDQNFTKILEGIVHEYNTKHVIKHYKVNFRGASRARNFGLSKANGDYILFIDDDAECITGSIERAINILNSDKDLGAICGKIVDRNGNDSLKKYASISSYLSLSDFEDKFIESSIIFRRDLLEKYKFDETLGCGTFHGAEEGYDLIFRMLKDNVKIYYDKKIIFYHPNRVQSHTTDAEIMRVFTYRCGYARLCQKHSLEHKYYKRLISVTLYIPYLAIFKRKLVRYYFAELLGLLSGRIIHG